MSNKVESLVGLKDDVSVGVFPEYVIGQENIKVAILRDVVNVMVISDVHVG